MHPIYSSTACLARNYRNLEDELAALAGAGINRIELGYSPAPSAGPFSAAALDAFPHVSFLVHNYFPAPRKPFVLNLAAVDPELLEQSRSFCEAAIELCARIGSPFYSVHCGFLAALEAESLGRELKFGAVAPYEEGYRAFTASLRRLLPVAQRAGIRLLLEPNVVAPFNLCEGRNRLLMFAEPGEFTRLLADFAGSGLGVLLDLGHLNVTAATLRFSREDFVAAVAPAIGGFHLHDNDGTADQHRPVTAGSWTLEIIRRPGFAGLPIVNEAQFADLGSLQSHNSWLDKHLNGQLIPPR